MTVHFEDIAVGQVDRFGHYEVTRDEVIAFATAYDPQPFHLDDAEAARYPIFGRIAASGWHTGAMAMRMIVDHWQQTGFVSLGASGLSELSWLKPVYPGDVLRLESEVLEARASTSRPELGFLKVRTVTFNQKDEPVMRQVANLMIGRRPQ
jgi:acyl dehydratase